MKKMFWITFLLSLLFLIQVPLWADTTLPTDATQPGNPFWSGPMAANPFPGTVSPWMPRGPGMGNYGFQGFNPGMRPGWGGSMQPVNPGMPSEPNYYNYGPGVMMGQGMMQFGMGPGMIRGIGGMGYISTEAFQKFFDETREMRKKLNGLMFDYAELLRKPDHDPAARVKIENEIMTLRQKVYDKAPRYQWPFK